MANVNNPEIGLEALINDCVNMRNRTKDKKKAAKMQTIIDSLLDIKAGIDYPIRFDFWMDIEAQIKAAEQKDPQIDAVILTIPLRVNSTSRTNSCFININNHLK